MKVTFGKYFAKIVRLFLVAARINGLKLIKCVLSPFLSEGSLIDFHAPYCVIDNMYAACGLFGQYKVMQKPWNIIETLTNWYSYESTWW